MRKKARKYFIPGIGIAASVYCSWSFAAGAVAGFYIAEIFMRKFVGTGKIKLLKFDIKDNWEVHLHHWIWPSLAIIGIGIINTVAAIPLFILGFFNGLIFHDIYTDKKWRDNEKSWYHVVYKK
ncbi:MAG: hypothetical protein Q8N69_01395 [bacterium]|nr:hypothetical protein [bacterium]